MGAFKRDVVVLIKMGAYIFMGCLLCVGYPDFTVQCVSVLNTKHLFLLRQVYYNNRVGDDISAQTCRNIIVCCAITAIVSACVCPIVIIVIVVPITTT